MPPFLLPINTKCKECARRATQKLYSDGGLEIGQFCRSCGRRHLKMMLVAEQVVRRAYDSLRAL